MLLKLLLRFGENPSMKQLCEITNVQRSKDDIEVLNKTVLQKIVEGLQVIKDGSSLLSAFQQIVR